MEPVAEGVGLANSCDHHFPDVVAFALQPSEL
jgi:hypothetical protein